MIRILVADDHEVLRWGLVQSLSGEPDMVVVGEADEAGAAVAEWERLAPDVLIVDLYMPGGGGWVVLDRALASRPDARVVILSAADDARTVQTSLARGARAHVPSPGPLRSCSTWCVRSRAGRSRAAYLPTRGPLPRHPAVPATRRQRAAPAVATRAPADHPPSKRYWAWAR